MRTINRHIIHTSYTRPSQDIGADEIRQWHTSPDPNDPSKPWRDIGYHYVIRRDGTIEKGRLDAVMGAHVGRHNFDSIGTCLIGGMKETDRVPEFNYTKEQLLALFNHIEKMEKLYPGIETSGHNDWDTGRSCPVFNVKELLRNHPKNSDSNT